MPAAPSHEAAAKIRGRLLVAVAALLWSTSGFFAKAPYFDGWPGPTLAFWRAVFACVILVPLALWHVLSEWGRRDQHPLWGWALVPMTLLFAAMNYTYLTAMANGSAANAIWLQCTAPVWVLLVGVFVFGERATWRDWVLIGFVAAGVGVILFYESRGASLPAVFWGLAAGALYGGIVLSLRQLRAFDSAWMAMLNHSVTAVVLLPLAMRWIADPFAAEQPVTAASSAAPHFPHGIQWLLLAAFGILQMGLPYVLFARALRSIAGHEATGIGLLEPIVMPLWVWLAWHEAPRWWTMAGGALILAGLAIRYVFVPPAPTLAPPETVGLDEAH
jgi:DME family drug/metabolite transporter